MHKLKSKIILAIHYAFIQEFWLKDELEKLGYDVVLISNKFADKNASKTRRGRIISNFSSICFGSKIFRAYQDEDIVICWDFLTAFVFSILDLLTRKTKEKTKIVALHMLIINPSLIKKLLLKSFCYASNLNPRLTIVVNSEYERILYSKEYYLNINNTIILADCANTMVFYDYESGDGRIFCGGDNSRDWGTFFEAARILKDVKFVGIARKMMFDFSLVIPSNCEMYFDTDVAFFYETLKSCSIVVLPLNVNVASGLVVLCDCASYFKPIIATCTSCTTNYINNMENGILLEKMGNANELANSIVMLLSDEALQEKIGKSFSENIRNNHSQSRYAKDLIFKIS